MSAKALLFIDRSRTAADVAGAISRVSALPAPLFLLVMLAPAAEAQVPHSAPITVTGHQWAPFISPMGEPFRARTAGDDTLANWFRQADRNGDGVLTAAELQADAERFFAKLDSDHDGAIGPDELANYEYELAPEIQVMSRTKRTPGQPQVASKAGEQRRAREEELDAMLGIGGALQGAARYSLLNMPEPVAAADTDFNRAITLEEFRAGANARFQLLDSARQGRLTLAQLEAMPHAPSVGKRRAKRNDEAPDSRLGNPLPPEP